MTEWRALDNATAPYGDRVLILFPCGHIEDATIHQDMNGAWRYCLFDGEMINDTPTHWMPLPEPPERTS